MRKLKYKIKPHNLIFIYLVTTIIVTTISLSKFYSSINSSNSTKVALYAIDAYAEDSESKDLVVDCAGEDNLKLTDSCSYVITNEVDGKIAEVGLTYKIKVDFEEELPSGITIAVKDENGKEGIATTTENSYIFENEAWKFTAGTLQENIITITFTGENKESATSTIISNVQVSVIAEQVD